MGTRRKSRELAMEALFYMDMRESFTAQAMAHFRSARQVGARALPFFIELVEGVTANRSCIDAIIEQYSSNWKIGRMAGVDRNVLRIAVFEILFCPEVPVKVSLNEAIDIGKRYGAEDSGAFINGILDSIHIALADGALSPPEKRVAPLPDEAPCSEGAAGGLLDSGPRILPVTGRAGVVKRRSEPEADSGA
jgi:N utilization substance protein B